MVFRVVLGIVFTILSFNSLYAQATKPIAKAGVIDFSGWDFTKNGQTNLNGEWLFFYKKQIKPDDLLDLRELKKSSSAIEVPSNWANEERSPYTYSSYILSVKNLKNTAGKNLGITSFGIQTSSKFYFLSIDEESEEKKVIIHDELSTGKFALKEKDSIPQRIRFFKMLKSLPENFYVLVNTSNYQDSAAGITRDLEIDFFDRLREAREPSVIRDNLVNGAILIMAIYHFFLFYLRREDLASFYFGVFSLLIFIRIAAQESVIYDWSSQMSNFTYNLRMKIEFIDLNLLVPFLAGFVSKVFEQSFKQKYLKYFFYMAGLCSLFVLITPPKIFIKGLFAYEIVLLIIAIYLVRIIFLEFRKGHPAAKILISATLILALCMVNDILYASLIIKSTYLVPFGLLLFMFSQSYIISKRFAAAQRKAEYLSENLKDEVDKQTLELRNKSNKLEEQNDIIATQYDKMKNDVLLAANVMSAMLPDNTFVNGHCSLDCFFIPADELAGDLYGMEAREHRLMFWLCDVTGHGVASSMVAGVVREGMASCRIETLFTSERPDPAEALRLVCRQVARSIKGKFFATMSLGVYDFKSKMLTVASAAHLKPIHFRDGTWNKKSVGKIPNGPLIGYGDDDSIAYTNFEVTLEAGDFLFFYTDGVNEAAFSDETEQFGKKRIVRFLKKNYQNDTVLEDLLQEVLSFQEKKELDDDITMACLRIK